MRQGRRKEVRMGGGKGEGYRRTGKQVAQGQMMSKKKEVKEREGRGNSRKVNGGRRVKSLGRQKDRQTGMRNQVKDIEGARKKGVTARENGEFKMTVSELTASSLFLPY